MMFPSLKSLTWHLLAACLIAACQQKIPSPDFSMRDGDKAVRNLTFENVNLKREIDPKLLQPPKDTYLLGPGDVLDIEIAEIGSTLARTFVMPDGMVYYNLAGGVRAEGLPVQEFAKRLRDALKRDYTNPQPNVSLIEVRSRRYWILGRVYKPGLFPLLQPTTLQEAIGNSGGLSSSGFSGTTEELADLANSIVIRDGQILPINFSALVNEGDASQNIYLRHNDYIYLPSSTSSTVLMLGAVNSPQAMGYKDKLTLVESIAGAHGITATAYPKQVVVVRGTFQKPTAAVVNLTEILTGKVSDVLLQPGDIVWVPDRPLGYLENIVKDIFRDSARTIGAREGARMVGSSETPQLTIPGGAPTSP